MGLFGREKSVGARFGEHTVTCRLCAGDQFWRREIKLNTSGMELLDLGWANESALGLVCVTCGYVHEFVGDALELWQAEE